MEIHIGNRVADVELLGKDGNKVRLDIDGQPYEVDIVMAENGACSILHDGHSYNAELIRSGGGKNYQVNTLFSSYSVLVFMIDVCCLQQIIQFTSYGVSFNSSILKLRSCRMALHRLSVRRSRD